MGECQAELPADEGGIQLPNLRASHLAMAGSTVGRWSTGSTCVGRLVGDILLAERLGVHTYLTPGHGDDVGDPTSWARMMWAARSTVVRDTLRDSHFVAEIAIIRASDMNLRGNWLDAQWVDGEISFTVAKTSLQALRPIISKRSALRGTLCDEWLHYASLNTSTWLRSATEVAYKAGFLARVVDQCSTLGDVIRWRVVQQGTITFSLCG